MRLKKQLILASKSPRRQQLLREIGLNFKIVPAKKFKEKNDGSSPEKIAIRNAVGKAQEVASTHPNAYILGVDTLGAYQHHILGKPKDTKDARRILGILSGTTHEVISAICIIETDKNCKQIRKKSHVEKTYVTFAKMTRQEINAYINSGESMDKAAAFAIQGLGSLFIKKIDGDYFNVVGLPIFALHKMLKAFGEKLV